MQAEKFEEAYLAQKQDVAVRRRFCVGKISCESSPGSISLRFFVQPEALQL
jgi:hypothetical protein